ncbi:MAG: hypothetical protein EA358_04210 [Flavobacteriales bacterium]|nr:MAG: hypothetical protein EA358_04210 [Flavobacteriales bacterium]
MKKYSSLICFILVNFLHAQVREVLLFSESNFAYGSTEAQVLLIRPFPNEGGWVNLLWKNDTISKWIPAGSESMSYEVKEGNRGNVGVWFRASGKPSAKDPFVVGFMPADRWVKSPETPVATDDLIAAVVNDQVNDEENVPAVESMTDSASLELEVVKGSDDELAIIDSVVVLKVVEDTVKPVSIDIDTLDIWGRVELVAFEFDRMRILREYIKDSGCKKQDISRALSVLRYDPSRLELLKFLAEVCPDELRPNLPQWGEEYFVYPQFRSQVIRLL